MATYDDITDFGGDFWVREDAKAAEDAKRAAEDSKRSRTRRILRAHAAKVRKKRSKSKNGQEGQVTLLTEAFRALGTIDDGINAFANVAFGSTKKSQANQDSTRKMDEEEGRDVQEEIGEEVLSHPGPAPEPVPLTQEEIEQQQEVLCSLPEPEPEPATEPVPLTQKEIEQKELEALKALVEGKQLVTVSQPKNAGQALDDGESDLKELQIEFKHYIEMLKQHSDDIEKEKRQGQSQDLMSVLKDVERKHEEQLLEKHRKQNGMYDTNTHQIWDYVGEYYTGGVKSPSNPSRVAPSPENMLRRMKPINESEESREARLNKVIDALNTRMAKQAAARRQRDNNEFEDLQTKTDLYDENILLGLFQDLAAIIDFDNESEDEEAESNSDRKTAEENLASTLEQLDEDFYQEIQDATRGEHGVTTANKDTGGVPDEEEGGGFFDNACFGMGLVEGDAGTVDSVPRTAADSSNGVDSQNVAYTLDHDQEVSDASEGSNIDRTIKVEETKEDPPANGWFSCFSPPPPKEAESPIIPQEIVLQDPPESRQEAEEAKPPGEAKPPQHIKKGLKIVAILECDEEIQAGSADKPIVVEPTNKPIVVEPEDTPGLIGCWAGSQHDLLTSE